MKKTAKGSLTAEASYIVGMTILMFGVVITLWIYSYQTCWYTQAVCECLLTGESRSILGQDAPQTIAQTKWEQLESGNALVPENLQVQIQGDEDYIFIRLTGEVSFLGNQTVAIKIEQSIDVVRPVKFIRKVAAIRKGKG